MKKTYQNPTTKVVMIKTMQMIAVSGFNRELNNTGDNGSKALGRRGSSWDDEDDYDE